MLLLFLCKRTKIFEFLDVSHAELVLMLFIAGLILYDYLDYEQRLLVVE